MFMEKMLKRIIEINKKALSSIESQIDVANELKEPAAELFHNSRLLENLSKNIQNIEQIGQMEHVQNEAKHIIRDLAHITDKDAKIKKLGEKTISRFKDHRLKITKDASGDEAKKITILTVEEKEITRDEERVIELIENNKHTIKQALYHLTILSDSKFNNKSQIMDALAMVGRALIQLKQVYLITQAIIQLEVKIKKEEQELEEGLEKIKKAA